MTKTIQISDELHNYLIKKTIGKESFGKTLKRLLGKPRGRKPKGQNVTITS